MKLAIILATANRSEIIRDTLISISRIACGDNNSVRLIVVDQSFDDKTYSVLCEYIGRIDFVYIHALNRGLSHSRNIGLKVVYDCCDVDYVCFGDDDCGYEVELLSKIRHTFSESHLDLVSVGVHVPGTTTLTTYTKRRSYTRLTRFNIATCITSISIFLDVKALRRRKTNFNEKLGLGAYFASCEELDFVHRLLDAEFTCGYYPDIRVFHENHTGYSQEKTYQYAIGHGALTKIFLSKRSPAYLLLAGKNVIKAFLKFPAQFLVKRNLYPKSYILGFLKGFFEWDE